ncbi:MAG: hypothetical protein ACLT98_16640 [Eggerthellaceae bacterium]
MLGLARDAADLRVREVAEAVDDVASGLLKALRPLDVIALVEAGAQLERGSPSLPFSAAAMSASADATGWPGGTA